MMLRALTGEKVTGTGTLDLTRKLLGGIVLSADGTNAAAVVIRKDSSSGDIIFDLSAKQPGYYLGWPIEAADRIYYSISGTGAFAQIYEYVP